MLPVNPQCRLLDELSARKWSNPYALEKVMEVFKIDQYSSNYPPELFDPAKVRCRCTARAGSTIFTSGCITLSASPCTAQNVGNQKA
eukprot:3573544-Amphidinium_carterae.1